MEIRNLLSMQVNEVKSNLSQIGFDVGIIHKMVAGLVSCHLTQYFQNMYSLTWAFTWLMILYSVYLNLTGRKD